MRKQRTKVTRKVRVRVRKKASAPPASAPPRTRTTRTTRVRRKKTTRRP